MPKINHEEYEVLKGLDDKWKWIARDKDRGLYAFTEKPVRKCGPSPYWDTETEWPYAAFESLDEIHLFQFIQWEDEEPHNIAELIEEYEHNANYYAYQLKKISQVIYGEGEETEVKNIEWLKEEIEEDIKSWGGGNPDYFRGASDAYENVKDWLNQLDEPEVLSHKWVSDNAVVGQYPDGMGYVVPAYRLQNLLVPKQEEVDQAYKDGYEKGKQHTFYKGYLEGLADKENEPETVADVISDFWKSFERLKEVLGTEVKELEE